MRNQVEKGLSVKKIAKFLSNIKGWCCGVFVIFWAFANSLPAYAASGIGGSKLATGTEKLIEDATTWLLVIAPTVTVVAVIYYFIRKAMCDEMDFKKCCARKYA